MFKARKRKPAGDLEQRLLAGDRRALARAISAVENETAEAPQVLRAVHSRVGKALVVGFTGPPGVGKSTLLSATIRHLRQAGKTVGVVAVDPSSPISGGAILGDRVRMAEHGLDDGVFVRSLASRGQLGGLSRAAARVVDVMDGAGWEVVIVETVGAGQSDVDVSGLVRTNVVVVAPGLGDEIQALKAGMLETAHILVVNKSDLPMAEMAARQLRDTLALSHKEGWQVPVLQTTATDGAGVAELVGAIERHQGQAGVGARKAEARQSEALRRMRWLIAVTAGEQVRAGLADGAGEQLDALCAEVLAGDLDVDSAAAMALASFGKPTPDFENS